MPKATEAKKTKVKVEVVRKPEFAEQLAAKLKITKGEAELMIDGHNEVIQDNLLAGKQVQFLGFGTYESRTRSARKGRNPQTGQAIEIAESKNAHFNAGATLKDTLNGKVAAKAKVTDKVEKKDAAKATTTAAATATTSTEKSKGNKKKHKKNKKK